MTDNLFNKQVCDSLRFFSQELQKLPATLWNNPWTWQHSCYLGPWATRQKVWFCHAFSFQRGDLDGLPLARLSEASWVPQCTNDKERWGFRDTKFLCLTVFLEDFSSSYLLNWVTRWCDSLPLVKIICHTIDLSRSQSSLSNYTCSEEEERCGFWLHNMEWGRHGSLVPMWPFCICN